MPSGTTLRSVRLPKRKRVGQTFVARSRCTIERYGYAFGIPSTLVKDEEGACIQLSLQDPAVYIGKNEDSEPDSEADREFYTGSSVLLVKSVKGQTSRSLLGKTKSEGFCNLYEVLFRRKENTFQIMFKG
jgi:hypothetical protein